MVDADSDHPVQRRIVLAGGLVSDDELFLIVNHEGIGRDAVHQEHIGADGGVGADDGFATENSGIRVDDDVVADVGVALAAFDDTGSEWRSSIELNPRRPAPSRGGAIVRGFCAAHNGGRMILCRSGTGDSFDPRLRRPRCGLWKRTAFSY